MMSKLKNQNYSPSNKKIELKSNAKLNWFTDLDKHLKRTLANEL